LFARVIWLRGMEMQNQKARDRCITFTEHRRSAGSATQRASLHPERSRDIIDLYDRVHIGTHVLITLRRIDNFVKPEEPSCWRDQVIAALSCHSEQSRLQHSGRSPQARLSVSVFRPTISCDDVSAQRSSEFVSGLIQLDIIRAGDDHHDDPAVCSRSRRGTARLFPPSRPPLIRFAGPRALRDFLTTYYGPRAE
jgi:hypothetical protein